MAFSNSDKRDMLRIFYVARGNSVVASNNYLEAYPERRQPDRSLFLKLDRNLAEYGSFRQDRQRYGNRVSEEDSLNILEQVCISVYGFFFLVSSTSV